MAKKSGLTKYFAKCRFIASIQPEKNFQDWAYCPYCNSKEEYNGILRFRKNRKRWLKTYKRWTKYKTKKKKS